MKKTFLSLLFIATFFNFLPAQNVGIGVDSPLYRLDIAGTLHSTGNAYLEGAVGIGTTFPNYKLQVNNGAIAMYNTSDTKTWYFNYTTAYNGVFYLAESGIARLAVANGGNIGIGTFTPSAKLDVVGSGNYSGNLTIANDISAGSDVSASGNVSAGGSVNAAGNITAHGGGVLYNTESATNLKIYRRTAAFQVTGLAAHSLSIEGTVGIGGGYTSAPSVFVGDITTTGGTAGPLYQLQLVTYGATPTSFKIRILNNSDYAITQNITWNIMCVGN